MLSTRTRHRLQLAQSKTGTGHLLIPCHGQVSAQSGQTPVPKADMMFNQPHFNTARKGTPINLGVAVTMNTLLSEPPKAVQEVVHMHCD